MRIFRTPSQETRQKISRSKMGQRHTEAAKQKISASLKRYWQTIPDAPETNTDKKGVQNETAN